MRSLWPKDLGSVEEQAPALLLREQAAYLGAATDNIVVGEVNRLTRRGDVQDDKFVYGFYLVAPALDKYSYRLFIMEHPVELYPVTFVVDDELEAELLRGESDERLVAKTEEEYLGTLERLFSAGRTRRIVGALMAQSEKFTPPGAVDDDIPF